MAGQVHNPNTPEAEAGGLGGHCYPGLNSKILSQDLSSALKHLLLTAQLHILRNECPRFYNFLPEFMGFTEDNGLLLSAGPSGDAHESDDQNCTEL